jgi:hypothetical protein
MDKKGPFNAGWPVSHVRMRRLSKVSPGVASKLDSPVACWEVTSGLVLGVSRLPSRRESVVYVVIHVVVDFWTSVNGSNCSGTCKVCHFGWANGTRSKGQAAMCVFGAVAPIWMPVTLCGLQYS